MPVMRSSVYGWRCPRIRSQPSSWVRKCQSLRCLPCDTTSASTRAPETVGAPSFTSGPSPTSSTSSSSLAPTSWVSFSTLRRSPCFTRYCFPPVLITAYISNLPAFRPGPAPLAGKSRRGARKGTGDLAGPCHGVKLWRSGDVFPHVDERRLRRLHHVEEHAWPGGVLGAGGAVLSDPAGVHDVVVGVPVAGPHCPALRHLRRIEGERLSGVPAVAVDGVEHHRFRRLESAAAGTDVGVRNAGDGGLGRLLATEEGEADDSEGGNAHSGLQEGGKGLMEGRAGNAALGDDGGDVAGGSDVESRVEHLHALRGDPRAGQVRDFRRRALLDGDLAPARGTQIDRAGGSSDEEGHFGGLRRERQRIRADLVRRVAVARDAIGADHHAADPAAAEQRRRGDVG